MLILDEPTSAVDIHTEQEIMQATRSLLRGRTTFVIAHRLSTVRDCDLILALKQGRMVAATSDLDQAIQALDDAAAAVTSGAQQTAAARPGVS